MRQAPTVRKATIHDVLAITELHKEGWRAGYATLFTPEVLAKAIEKHCTRWPRVFSAPDFPATTMLVAELDGEVVGFAHFGPGDHDAGHFENSDRSRTELYSLYVRPSRWGTGVAALLVDQVLKTLAQFGQTRLHLTTYEGVPRARRFYEKYGFKLTGRRTIYQLFDDVPVPEVEYIYEP